MAGLHALVNASDLEKITRELTTLALVEALGEGEFQGLGVPGGLSLEQCEEISDQVGRRMGFDPKIVLVLVLLKQEQL